MRKSIQFLLLMAMILPTSAWAIIIGDPSAYVTGGGNMAVGQAWADRPLVVRATASPQHAFAVKNQANSAEIFTLTVDASGNGMMTLRNSSNATKGIINSNGVSYFMGGNVGIGTATPATLMDVAGELSCNVINIRGGSDLSEGFTVNSTKKVEPGMVVSIDPKHPGELMLSQTAYDTKVAGIVSGAGGVSVGIKLGQAGTLASGNMPIAMAGRVYCWADASYGEIQPGDSLCASDTPGHAMKSTKMASGAMLGKAMTGLKDGKGLVLVLVNLH